MIDKKVSNGSVVNLTLPSSHGGSLKITPTAPLTFIYYPFLIYENYLKLTQGFLFRYMPPIGSK